MDSSQTPTLSRALGTVLDRRLSELRTCMVARVERFDAALGCVDVQPLVKNLVEDATGALIAEREAVITNVPLLAFGGGGVRFNVQPAVGDLVTLLVADRSLDKWKSFGGEVDPGLPTQHHRADCLALPGVHYFGAPWSQGPSIGHDQGPQIFFSQVAIALGDQNATDAAIKGTALASALSTLTNLLATFASAVGGALPAASVSATALGAGITVFNTSVTNALSTKVKVG